MQWRQLSLEGRRRGGCIGRSFRKAGGLAPESGSKFHGGFSGGVGFAPGPISSLMSRQLQLPNGHKIFNMLFAASIFYLIVQGSRCEAPPQPSPAICGQPEKPANGMQVRGWEEADFATFFLFFKIKKRRVFKVNQSLAINGDGHLEFSPLPVGAHDVTGCIYSLCGHIKCFFFCLILCSGLATRGVHGGVGTWGERPVAGVFAQLCALFILPSLYFSLLSFSVRGVLFWPLSEVLTLRWFGIQQSRHGCRKQAI